MTKQVCNWKTCCHYANVNARHSSDDPGLLSVVATVVQVFTINISAIPCKWNIYLPVHVHFEGFYVIEIELKHLKISHPQGSKMLCILGSNPFKYIRELAIRDSICINLYGISLMVRPWDMIDDYSTHTNNSHCALALVTFFSTWYHLLLAPYRLELAENKFLMAYILKKLVVTLFCKKLLILSNGYTHRVTVWVW